MKLQADFSAYGKRFPSRTAYKVGYSCLISIPMECLGRKYTRYIDQITGIVTLVPVDTDENIEGRQQETGEN